MAWLPFQKLKWDFILNIISSKNSLFHQSALTTMMINCIKILLKMHISILQVNESNWQSLMTIFIWALVQYLCIFQNQDKVCYEYWICSVFQVNWHKFIIQITPITWSKKPSGIDLKMYEPASLACIRVLQGGLLCILTSKQVLRMPLAGQNLFFWC